MSFLTPLYVLGALAVAAPIVFHLIRRTPKGEVPFSSLMFLAATPPRLTRRSRLDDWLLLALRAAALLLLAAAFARPFLREAAALDSTDGERRRVAVLVDTSASLRRDGAWARAKELAEAAIAEVRPGDELALFAFDDTSRPVFTFAESATLDADRRKAVARARLGELAPTWGATDLGQGLADAVGAVEEVADESESAGRMPRKIVLIGDLQQGSRLDALGVFEWPKDVALEVRAVSVEGANASLQRLDDSAGDEGTDGELRVRVSNEAGSAEERFRLGWVDEEGGAIGPVVDAYVPPGQSRVVRVARPDRPATRLRLTGDDHGFDNTLFVADEPVREATVLYVGEDAADDAGGLLYFLERAFLSTPRRTVEVRKPAGAEIGEAELGRGGPLVVLAGPVAGEGHERLRRYLEAGGTVLVVLRDQGQGETVAALAGVPEVRVEEAAVDGDVMLGEIGFDHPLFAPFAGPQFNDFTKIRFWKYRKFDAAGLGEARTVARFENGDPAVVEKNVGKGRLVVFASGWHPADSQLARSSKFVPLMTALLDRGATGSVGSDGVVNAAVPVPVPAGEAGEMRVVQTPGGEAVELKADATSFGGTDRPGVYSVEVGGEARRFAVNLDPGESRTAALAVETLERLGVRTAADEGEALTPEQRRQMLNAELEGRQKLWRWLILAAVGVLIAETWLAGRIGRPRREGVAAA